MKILLSILTLFLMSCSQDYNYKSDSENPNRSTHSETKLSQANDQFQSFLDKFPKVELPIKIKGCEVNYKNFTLFNEVKPSPYISNNSYAVGQIKTNGNYVSVITLGAADCMLPIITTYKLTGEKIDSKTIAIGYCGNGPCFKCDEFMTLNEDFTLFTADTIVSSKCDEDYNSIVGTESIDVIYKEGRLTENGEIELSEEIKKKIK